ncbi:MAG: hypothetical protein ACOYL9_05080 [Ilumatobacteraceae bacterium]
MTVKLEPGAIGLADGVDTTRYSSGNFDALNVLLHANGVVVVIEGAALTEVLVIAVDTKVAPANVATMAPIRSLFPT